MLSSVLEGRSSSIIEHALVYSAIAIGSHSRNVEKGKTDDLSEIFFQRSLQSLSGILLAKDHLLKLQVCGSMTLLARTEAYTLIVAGHYGKCFSTRET